MHYTITEQKKFLAIRRIYFLSICLCLLTFCAFFTHAQPIQSLTVNDGLSINEVLSIYQDKQQQYIWVGTQSGLNRYNGHDFKTFYIDRDSARSSNLIHDITEDGKNTLWLATNVGLACFDYIKSEWVNLPDTLETNVYSKIEVINDSSVFAVRNGKELCAVSSSEEGKSLTTVIDTLGVILDIEDWNDKLLIGTRKGMYLYDPNKQSLELRLKGKAMYCSYIKYIEDDKAIWYKSGWRMFRVPIENEIMQEKNTFDFSKNFKNKKKHRYYFTAVDYDGVSYWLAESRGVVSYNKKSRRVSEFLNVPYLTEMSLNSIWVDNMKNIWGGTWQSGVLKMNPNEMPFHTIRKSANSDGLSSHLVRAFSELEDGRVLIGTETNGLLIFNIETQRFEARMNKFNTDKNSEFTVRANNLHAVLKDWKGRIWCGYFYKGFNVSAGEDKQEINALIKETMGKNSRFSCETFLCDSVNKRIYIGTRYKIIVFDEKTMSINKVKLNVNTINVIKHDNKGNVCYGELEGLYTLNDLVKQTAASKEVSSKRIMSKSVNTLFLGSKNNLWIGTHGNGLWYKEHKTGTLKHVSAPEHINYRVVYSILEDDRGKMWMGTNNGLVRFDPKNNEFRRYGIEDGIQDNQFNYNSALKTKNGMLFFGGIKGFTYFHPDSIDEIDRLTKPIFSSLKVGEQQEPLYDKKQMRRSITIPYANNSFEFRFFSPDFSSSKSNIYAYRLKGHSKRWQFCAPNNPVAIFTNLPSGKYRLEVKATRPNTDWSEASKSPLVVIAPPWHLSSLAFVVYGLVVLGIFFISILITKQRANYRNSIKIASLEKEKSEQVSQAKLRFFTDIAHEIRTPLTLISAPLNDMLSKRKFDVATQNSLELMQKSTSKLSSLIDELLLFRKAESGNLPLKLQRFDFVKLIETVSSLYGHEIAGKNILLKLDFHLSKSEKVYDGSKIEKVLSNLLNNAIKYTPKNGTIWIETEEADGGFRFSVADSGKGMNELDLKQIFTRFYQAGKSPEKGFGIGLALAKRIVEAHEGTLTVESELQKGSKFTVSVPKLEVNCTTEVLEDFIPKAFKNAPPALLVKHKKAVAGNILIVEDNEQIRSYLASIFESDFNVMLAENGREGFEVAINNLPDAIISDYQMPEMDGIKMCKKLKTELLTSHIPIVLLSAFNEVEDQLKGLEVGADDYMGKPFDKDVIYQKITNLIVTHRQIIKSFQSGKSFDLVRLEKPDQRFIEKINLIIHTEMANEKLDVPFLCGRIGISRTSLNEKLRSMLDISPAEYIKKTKLQEGYRLLSEDGCSVSDAAYATGFSPTYFATCFKKEFGISPGKLV